MIGNAGVKVLSLSEEQNGLRWAWRGIPSSYATETNGRHRRLRMADIHGCYKRDVLRSKHVI
jgi:hypothetical protein